MNHLWLPDVPSFDFIFVGGVPRGTTVEVLREAFAREGGDVGWIDLVKDPTTGENRGFAFVELLSRFDSAVDPRALDALASARIDGRLLEIKESPDGVVGTLCDPQAPRQCLCCPP